MIQQCAMVRITEALRNLGEHVKLSHAKPRWYIVSHIYIHTCLQSRGGIQGCFTICGVTALMYTPFAKSNGRFFSETKISMMPSSNLYDFWWVHKMHASVHFLCKIH